jgi:Ser/Thr protein kinase RdoA (MazF antagonist)
VTTALADDRAVSHRDELLDPKAVGEVISERLARDGRPVEGCERVRATYRFGESLRVLHRVDVDGHTFHVAARTFSPDRLDGVARRVRERAVPTDPLEPVVAVPELGAVFWTFPNDRKLVSLPALPATVAAMLGRAPSLRLAAYAPEKSAAVLCADDAGRPLAYAKLYADGAGATAARLHTELAGSLAGSAAAPRLPGILGYSISTRTLVVEPVEGVPVSDRDHFRAFGAALATVHGLAAPPGLARFERLLPPRLQRAARLVGAARPDVAGAARGLAERLVRSRGRSSEEPSVLHGDVHPKNALVDDGRITLIDLDQLAAGPAAEELGSALARLEYRHVTTGLDDGLADALLDGYAAVRDLPSPQALAWSTAAALLSERALRSVSRVRPEGLESLDALLVRAETILDEAP